MGCCPSTPRKPDPTRLKPQLTTRSASSRRHVAPPQEEEPVVKEVLSETPKPVLTRNPTRLKTRPDSKDTAKPVSEITKIIKPISEITRTVKPISEITRTVKPISEITKKPPPLPDVGKRAHFTPEIADVSEASEISVSTVPDEEFSGEPIRSPAKTQTRAYSGRVRATGPSPGRARSVPGRERNPDRVGVRERNLNRRRDSGEIYCGRGGGRLNDSPSIKKNNNGKSVVKIGSEVDNNNKMTNDRTRKIEGPVGGDESLENPLVSLECFIFL